MTQPFTYICRCGTEHQSAIAATPPGWSWFGGELVCDNCVNACVAEAESDWSPEPHPKAVEGTATSILLRSGVYLDLADPDCARVSPIDIASGLRQLRFSGQTPRPYTIAQHSLLVLRLVEPVAAEIGGENGQALRRCALLHDAAEAFIHDITRPLKSLLPDYREIEQQFEQRLFSQLGVVWNKPRREIVKRADLQALAIERRELLGCHDRWPVLEGIEHTRLARLSLGRIWAAEEAEERFLDAFHALQPKPERIAA